MSKPIYKEKGFKRMCVVAFAVVAGMGGAIKYDIVRGIGPFASSHETVSNLDTSEAQTIPQAVSSEQLALEEAKENLTTGIVDLLPMQDMAFQDDTYLSPNDVATMLSDKIANNVYTPQENTAEFLNGLAEFVNSSNFSVTYTDTSGNDKTTFILQGNGTNEIARGIGGFDNVAMNDVNLIALNLSDNRSLEYSAIPLTAYTIMQAQWMAVSPEVAVKSEPVSRGSHIRDYGFKG